MASDAPRRLVPVVAALAAALFAGGAAGAPGGSSPADSTAPRPGAAQDTVRIAAHPDDMDEMTIRAPAIHPSFPVGSTTLTRDLLTAQPGNVANDPLRTIQAQPVATSSGVDFNSAAAIRGGDSEEHRVYFDGFPLDHYAHVGGFTGIVYDDLVRSTTLIPGGAPLRYRGDLSGVILFEPVSPRETHVFVRYDITSMAVGATGRVGRNVSALASAKTSFFNLPAYQPVGVEDRSFRDGLLRITVGPDTALHAVVLALAAQDEEAGQELRGVTPERNATSVLGGVKLVAPGSRWRAALRLYGTSYRIEDDVSALDERRDHRLAGAHAAAEAEGRVGPVVVLATAEAGQVRHAGRGGDADAPTIAAAVEAKLLARRHHVLVLGVGGDREPWTRRLEPETYGALTLGLGMPVSLAVGFARSHESPFVFAQPREFASIPIDPGDLLEASGPAGRATAVEVDQLSARAQVELAADWTLETSAWRRRYRSLPTWTWSDEGAIESVASEGSGRADGWEALLRWAPPQGPTATASLAHVDVTKREGSLAIDRPGDFDVPRAFRLTVVAPLGRHATAALSWQARSGHPYTLLRTGALPPPDAEVNAERLPSYRRLDVKLQRTVVRERSEVSFFVDVLNVLDDDNTAMIYAVQLASGEYVSGSYAGVSPFPIFGIRARW